MANANPVANAYYSTTQIAWGSLLGGPIAGGHFLSHNFKVMGRPKAAKTTRQIVGLVTVLGSPLLYILQLLNPILFLTILAGILYAVASFLQKPAMLRHAAAGGTFFGNGRALWEALIAAAITVGIIAGLLLFVFAFIALSGEEVMKD